MTTKFNMNDKASPAWNRYLLAECLWELPRTALWTFKRPSPKHMRTIFTLIHERLKRSTHPYKDYLFMCNKALNHRRNALIHDHEMYSNVKGWFDLWELPVPDMKRKQQDACKESVFKTPYNDMLANAVLCTSHREEEEEFLKWTLEFMQKEAMEELLLFLTCIALKNFNHPKKS